MAAVSVTDQSVQLRFLVDKEKKKVVYAEAGKDFDDVLFSFLTLPLGTIVRLLSRESNMQSVSIGSLSSLYQKVIDLDEQYLSIKIGRKEVTVIIRPSIYGILFSLI